MKHKDFLESIMLEFLRVPDKKLKQKYHLRNIQIIKKQKRFKRKLVGNLCKGKSIIRCQACSCGNLNKISLCLPNFFRLYHI